GEAWVKYELGFTDTELGREATSTVDSASELFINHDPGVSSGELRICLVQGNFYFFHRQTSDGAWQAERDDGSGVTTALFRRTSFAPGAALEFPTAGVSDANQRIPLQVGVTVGFRDMSTNIRGEFDFVRLAR